MLNRDHPDDERLSALASDEADAMADATLAGHVASCPQCTAVVDELGALRANLAALPDVAPHRPLRLVPEVTGGADRLGTWVRKVFGPVMAAGATLALVGMVGTVAPSLSSPASMSDVGRELGSPAEENFEPASLEPAAGEVGSLRSAEAPDDPRTTGGNDSEGGAAAPGASDDGSSESIALDTGSARSVWPMVLFAGVAVLIAGALLRWIVVPLPADAG